MFRKLFSSSSLQRFNFQISNPSISNHARCLGVRSLHPLPFQASLTPLELDRDAKFAFKTISQPVHFRQPTRRKFQHLAIAETLQ
jgi:hypothetical protein